MAARELGEREMGSCLTGIVSDLQDEQVLELFQNNVSILNNVELYANKRLKW